MPRRLPDLAVILVYLIAITAFGARFRRSQKSLKDYFLGGRTVAWWAISLSIVAAETSTLTIIGTPALAYAGNLGFLQVVCGYLVARVVIAVLFIPQYFRGEMYTAYELMRRRFGEGTRRFTACTFLVVRALAEGVRVFAISIVVSIVLGTGEITSIVIIVLLTLFYTFEGGMTAVIWTDVVQMALYVAGGLLSFWLILARVPGGWAEVVRVAAPLGKFQIFDFRLELTREFFSRTYSFWAGLACGAFLATGTHGTDQLVVQRLLSARSERESKLALLASGVVILFQFTLFLLIGVLLYAFNIQTGRPAPQPLDRVYPVFIWNYLPVGLAGIIIAAILAAAMSNVSAALNSLASTTIMDFYKPLVSGAGILRDGAPAHANLPGPPEAGRCAAPLSSSTAAQSAASAHPSAAGRAEVSAPPSSARPGAPIAASAAGRADVPAPPSAAGGSSATPVQFAVGHGGAGPHEEDHYLRLSRWATVAWGLVLLGIALLARHWGSVLEAGLAVISVTIGALLGVFLLGVLTRRANQPGAIAGMLAGFATMLWLHFATRTAWTWYVVIVSSVTFAFGYLASLGSSRRAAEAPPSLPQE